MPFQSAPKENHLRLEATKFEDDRADWLARHNVPNASAADAAGAFFEPWSRFSVAANADASEVLSRWRHESAVGVGLGNLRFKALPVIVDGNGESGEEECIGSLQLRVEYRVEGRMS